MRFRYRVEQWNDLEERKEKKKCLQIPVVCQVQVLDPVPCNKISVKIHLVVAVFCWVVCVLVL